MESHAVNVGNVANEYAEAIGMIGRPKSRCLVMPTACKVIAGTSKFYLPHGVEMAFVSNEAAPCLKTP